MSLCIFEIDPHDLATKNNSLKNFSTRPKDKVEAELPAGCFIPQSR